MAHCTQCNYCGAGRWCLLKNRATTTVVCDRFEMSLTSRIVSRVKRVFGKG